jgi:dTDP-4-amino-4,6-dideoxygalactose transaminase
MQKIRRLYGNFYKVPFLSPYWDGREHGWIRHAVAKDKIVDGKELQEVESTLKKLLGVKYIRLFNYGRSAIDFAIRTYGIQGKEIIVPTLICKGVINPIVFSGNKPVFVDSNPDMNIDTSKMKQVVGKNTAGIVASHLTSKISNMDEINEFAEDYDLKVIDDSAQVLGNKHKEKCAGNLAEMGILSFGFGKVLMSTHGGAITTNNNELGETIENAELPKENRMEILSRIPKFYNAYILRRYTRPFYVIKDAITHPPIDSLMGHDYVVSDMSNLDAGLVKIQLEKLDEVLALRMRNALLMNELLGDVKIISTPNPKGRIFSKYIITFKIPNHTLNTRNKLLINLKRYLEINRIETEWPYMPIHTRTGCESFRRGDLSNAESLWGRMITLPVHPNMSEEDVVYVGEKVIDFFRRCNK